MSFVPLTTEEIASGQPVKTTTKSKIKNNFDDHESRIQSVESASALFPAITLRLSGGYSLVNGGVIEGILKTTLSMAINVTGIRILIDKAGTAGDTEIDILIKRGGGAFESIFTALPSANYTDGDDYLSPTGTLDPTKVELQAGDIIRVDQTAAQTDGRGYLVRIDWNKTFA